MDIPDVVRTKAIMAGASRWLEQVPRLVADLEQEWSMRVGSPYRGGTEAFVADVTLADGTGAVLKLLVPRGVDVARNEIEVLVRTDGEGCARLLKHDATRGALLLERLGRPLSELGLPMRGRHEILCDTAARVWRPAAGSGLPTGAEKGRWLGEFIVATWERLDRPCPEAVVDHALACARRRIDAHDDERAVLVHGDVTQWNALRAAEGFKLVDPDGLLAEAEYDMGIVMREDPVAFIERDGRERDGWLADRTGLDPTAIREWGAVERVSTGLLCTEVGLQPVGRTMLAAAEVAAAWGAG